MKQGGGKSKGASFERGICKQLSLWLSHGKHEDVLWRSAMSGGRSTVAFAKGKRLAAQAGDITCIHPAGHHFMDRFFIECKFYRDLNYTGLLTNKGNLVSFWAEAKTQAKRYGKLPLMIAKQNQLPITVCLSQAGAELLHVQYRAVLFAPHLSLRVLLFDDFLKWAVRPNEQPPKA